MRIAIYDRSSKERHTLAYLLTEAFYRRSMHLSLEQYEDERELFGDISGGELPDVVMLDLSVRSEEIWDLAERIRRLPFHGALVLTACTADAAVEGYDLDVGGYLLKPYRADAVERLVERLSRLEHPRCLTVCHYRTLMRLPFIEIAYIESCNTKCVIHLRNGEEYRVYRQLDELEKAMDDPRFLRCHQSFLVNMDTIVKADTHFELENGEKVAIRQRELRRMRSAYLAFLQRSESPRTENITF